MRKAPAEIQAMPSNGGVRAPSDSCTREVLSTTEFNGLPAIVKSPAPPFAASGHCRAMATLNRSSGEIM
jgi:hypothetical protein